MTLKGQSFVKRKINHDLSGKSKKTTKIFRLNQLEKKNLLKIVYVMSELNMRYQYIEYHLTIRLLI